VITTKGTINLKGVHLLSPGQDVHLAYSDGQNWIARVTRRLRVLNSFANPLKDVTSVLVGCKFAYMQDRKPPVKNITEAEANSDVPEVERRAYAQNISAAYVAQNILTSLGLTAASTIPFTNSKIADEWDLSSGFVQELARIAEAECYRCRINENEQVEFINLNGSSPVAGPLIAHNDLIDLTPQTVGELPADTVYAKYESTQLKPPDNDPNDPNDDDKRQKRDWEKDESFSTEQYIHSYTDEDGEEKEQKGVVKITTVNISTYDLRDRLVKRESTRTDLMGTTTTITKFEFKKGVLVAPPVDENGDPLPFTPPDPNEDVSEVTAEYTVTTSPLGLIASSCGFDGSIEAFRALPVAESQKTTVEYFKDEDTGITKTITTNKVPFVSTPFGSDEISKQAQLLPDRSDINWLSRVTGIINSASYLVEYGSEVRIRTEREYGLQKRPGQQARNKAEDQKTPSVEQQGELVWAVGSATSQTALELSPPYVSDDRIIKLGPGLYTVQKSDAAQKALNYARTENRLLLANRSGAGLQLLPIDTPPKPFDLFYVRLNGCTAAYRVNGTTWTINPTGFVCTVDGLFWGAIDGTVANAWFPLPPGATVLPATAAVTTNASPMPANAIAIPTGFDPLNPDLTSLFASLPTGTAPVYQKIINPAVIIPPYHETVELTAGIQVGAGFDIQEWIPTALDLEAGLKVGASVEAYNLVLAPTKEISITANAPSVLNGRAVAVPSAVVTVAPELPTVDKFTTVNVPATVVYVAGNIPEKVGDISLIIDVPTSIVQVAAIAPDKAGDASLIVAVPVATIQVAAVAPDRAGEDATKVLVPAAVVDVAAIAPQVVAQALTINVPTAETILLTGQVPQVNPGDPFMANVSLLLPLDGADNSTTFTDASSNNFAMTRFGNAVISTTDPKYGTGSLLLANAGDYISTPADSAFAFGTGDFTVECHCLFTSASNNGLFTFGQLALSVFSGYWWLSTTGSGGTPMGPHMAANTWAFVRVTRTGSSLRLFVDDAQVGSTLTNTTNLTGNVCSVGMYFSAAYTWLGKIDNFRVTKGVARTDAPPTGPFPTSTGASLYLSFDGTVGSNTAPVDLSGNNLAVTIQGTQTRYVVSNTQAKYAEAGFFDYLSSLTSNNVRLQIAGTNLLSFPGDFELQLWFWMTSKTNVSFATLLELGQYTNGIMIRHGGNPGVYINSTTALAVTAIQSLALSTWHHIAVCRIGTTAKVYINGVESASATVSGTINSTSAQTFIGDSTHSPNRFFSGYIDDLRILKGKCTITGNFTPTGPLG
jgi:hypothetical protein